MRGKLLGVVLLLWAGSVAAAPDDMPQEVLLLAHFKARMRLALSQVLNYTCLETIQRSAQSRRANSFTPLDTVRLEVSTVASMGGKELLAWPGARRFEEADPTRFTSGGLMGSGVFALFARGVFLHDTSTMQYHGAEEMAGRSVARFDFAVPEVWSGYRITANGTSAIVGMEGSFWIDPASLALVRMEVRADEIPAPLGISRAVTVIDYARMRIGDSDVLLPQDAKMLLTLFSGEVRRNEIEFSHCHEYGAESSIRFDMPETVAPTAAPRTPVDLPAGLTVSMALDAAIDLSTAQVGDILRAHVIEDVRRKGETIIPKGAMATGRIRGAERLRSPGAGFDLTVEVAALEWANMRAEFYGELLATRRAGRAPQIPGTGVLRVAGSKSQIPAGFRMNWRTLDPNSRLKSR
jgi:hypothetical protein